MYKLVVSDLDGTLLLPDKRMPEEIFSIVEKLYNKGIVFCPASGRQLPNLKKLFEPVLDKIAIIAENGGLAYFGGEVIYTNPTNAEQAKYALEIIDQVEGLYPLLSCSECGFYTKDLPDFVTAVNKSYNSAKRINSFAEVLGEVTALKISVWDEFPPTAEHGGKILQGKIEGLRVMISGHEWLDVSTPTANKGEALKALYAHMGIDKPKCLAFGDHMNDIEMLSEAGTAYITANAFPYLHQFYKTIKSNAEQGVIEKLKELL